MYTFLFMTWGAKIGDAGMCGMHGRVEGQGKRVRDPAEVVYDMLRHSAISDAGDRVTCNKYIEI